MVDDAREAAERRRVAIARVALVMALGVYAAVAVTVLLVGPDQVAGQIGSDGLPRRLDPTGPFVLVLSLSLIAMVALFVGIPRIVLRAPMAIVNVPHREKWDSPAGRRMLTRLLASDMLFITAATVLLFTVMLVISTLGGFGMALPAWVLIVVMLPYLAVVFGIAIGAYVGKRYVPPADPAEPVA